MRFAEPLAFLLLALVPLVLLFHVWLDRRALARLKAAGELHLLSEMSSLGPDRGRFQRWLATSLLSAALALMAVALARPQFGSRTEMRKARGMDVVLAIDLSRSMFAQDVAPSRLGRAQVELAALIDQLAGDRVGLLGFTSVAVPLCPLTVDHAALKLQLKSANPSDLPRGGTAIGAAIKEAQRMLTASPYKDSGKAIVVVTDGEEHEGDPEGPAKEAKEAGIQLHLVGVGSSAGEPIPLPEGGYLKDRAGQTVVSRLGTELLEKLGSATGGLVALPGAEGGLDLGPVRQSLARQKKSELEAREIRVYEERFRWLLGPAWVLLILSTLIRPLRKLKRARITAAPAVTAAMIAVWPLLLGAGPLERAHPEIERGNRALLDGKAGDALDAYTAAEKDLAGDPALVFNQGLAQAAKGELDKAISAFQTALGRAEDPSLRGQISFALGNAQRSLKKYEEAIAAYRQALLDDPSHLGARKNLELSTAMKRIQALAPKDPNKDGDKSERPDGGTSPDAGGNQDGGGGKDAGSDSPDGGGQGDGGGQNDAPDGGAGSPDAGPDGGGGSANEEQPPEAEPKEQENVEAILDAVEAQEKAAKTKHLLKKLPAGQVEKEW